VHQNDGSYLAHTQGRKHQTNLARRAAREEKETKSREGQLPGITNQVQIRKNLIKIGRPGYKIIKIRDPLTRQLGLLYHVEYPQISPDVVPRIRFMSAFEQKVEPPSKDFQYLVIAAEPYETISFKLPSKEVDRSEDKFWTWFDRDRKEYWIQMFFKTEREERYANVPGLAPSSSKR
jgi:splicing factor 3A subunit 2